MIELTINRENRDVALNSGPSKLSVYLKPSIKPLLSQISPPFQGKKVSKPPLSINASPSPNYSSLMNGRLYKLNTTVKLRVD